METTVETTSQQLEVTPVDDTTQVAETAAQPQEVTPPESGAQEPKEGPVQKRINQLTWKAHEAERRLNAELMVRQELEQRLQQLQEQQAEYMRRATMPRVDQFVDPTEYQRAMEQHSQQYIEQRQREAHEAMQRQQQAAARAQFNARLNARIAEGATKYPDFEAVITNPMLPSLTSANPAVVTAILEHEKMPDITYYLGKNPAEAHRIASLPPAQAIMEVGMIAATLAAKAPRQPSNAPAPPATVGGNQKATTGPSDSDSAEEWVRKREAQLKARGLR